MTGLPSVCLHLFFISVSYLKQMAVPGGDRRHLGVWVRVAMCAGLLVALGWLARHGVAGVAWSSVVAVITSVGPRHVAELAAIWVAGLMTYSIVLSGAMPGLGARRGLVVNLTGSAVANTIPLGGALATALNWRMLRGWGHTNTAFAAFSALTNALAVLTKLTLPILAVLLLSLASTHIPATLLLAAGACAAALVVCCAGVVGIVRRPSRIGSRETTNRWLAKLNLLVGGTRNEVVTIVRDRWPVLLLGSISYAVAQVLLFGFSMHAVGLAASVPVIVAAASIERLGTIVPLTPGGAGVAEAATIAWLIAAGFDPATVIAGVLLYRTFIFAMEIPVGGVALVVWAWRSDLGRQLTRRGGSACTSST